MHSRALHAPCICILTARCCTLLHALAGAHPPDLVIFLGLAVYAVAGCKAQDLRVESSNQVDRALIGCFRATHDMLEAASE